MVTVIAIVQTVGPDKRVMNVIPTTVIMVLKVLRLLHVMSVLAQETGVEQLVMIVY